MEISKKLIKKITELDFKSVNNEFCEKIKETVLRAVLENKEINFISFTCSTINPSFLFSSTPWLYVRTDTENNNLTPDIISLEKIMSELRLIYPRVRLKIIIGNTDPYYIYLQQFRSFPNKREYLWRKFISRWNDYENNFRYWINECAPAAQAEIINWYRLEKDIENNSGTSFEREFEVFKDNIFCYFEKKQFDWELRKLQTQFDKNAYFNGLEKPGDSLLRDWILRKFAEYAIQGAWIYENIENPILIQNEKPSDLRSQMYQPAIKTRHGDVLPIVYFFGVDNAGYQ